MSETVKITEAAALQIKDMMKQTEEEGSYLRVAVKGGGCSGLSYGMGFVQDAEEGDIQFEQHGLKVVVDKEDASILNGTVIDYKESIKRLIQELVVLFYQNGYFPFPYIPFILGCILIRNS